MSRVKLKPYGRNHSIANVFLPFLGYLETLLDVEQIGNGLFIWKGNNSDLRYEFKGYHPDKHSIKFIAHCREGKQIFFLRIEPYEPEIIIRVIDLIESYH